MGTPPDAAPDAARNTIAELSLRLQGSQEQERAAREEARRLSRELALARRLLAFSFGADAPARHAHLQPPADKTPRVRAVPLKRAALFFLDACRSEGTHVLVAGWAFVPVPAWDGLMAAVTILWRHGGETYAAAAGRTFRLDVAAHFAAQSHEASGGAQGLAGVGFGCEVAIDSLPAGVELEIDLRLECRGLVCEQSTGRSLRL